MIERIVGVLTLALSVAGPIAAQEEVFVLDGLIVTAGPQPRSAGAVASHVTVLEGADLRERGLTRIEDALREVAGLTVVRTGSFGATTSVFMRGGESDYVQVLVDGVKVNQPGGAFDFAGLVLDNVERIEVVRGPASSLYGSDAVAGVIQVITRSGLSDVEGTLSLRRGSFGERAVSASLLGGSDRVSWSLSGSSTRTDGLLDFNNGQENTVLGGVIRLAPDAATRATLSVRLGDRSYHFPTDGSGAVVDRNAFTFGAESTLGIRVDRVVHPRLTLSADVSVNEVDAGTDDQPDSPADSLGFFGFSSLDNMRRAGADLRARIAIGDAVATLGWEVEEQRQRSFSESMSQFGSTFGRSDDTRWNRAYYVHVAAGVGPLSLTGGTRLDDNERFGTFATWTLGASWPIEGTGTRLRASAGTGVKEPTFFENFATGFVTGNPDLEPERSRSWEVGVDTEVADGVSLGVTYFDQIFRDLIQFTFTPPAPGGPNYVNVASALARGTEVSASADFGRVFASAEWTWLDSEVVDSGFDEGPDAAFVEGARLLRRPTHSLGARVGLRAGVGDVWAEVRRVGDREDRNFSSFPAVRTTLDAFTGLALGGALDVGRGIRLRVRGDNLLDERYEEVLGFPAPGRAFYVGADITLGGA